MPQENRHCGPGPRPDGTVIANLPAEAVIWRDGEYASQVGENATLELTFKQANDLLVDLANKINAISAQSAAESRNQENTVNTGAKK